MLYACTCSIKNRPFQDVFSALRIFNVSFCVSLFLGAQLETFVCIV